MTGFFGPLIFIINMSGTLILVFREKIERMIPAAFILPALFLFPFGFLGKLTLGVYLLAGISLIFPVYLFVEKKLRKRDISKWTQMFFSSGLLIFILVYTAVYFINLKRSLSLWDEFSFWGPKMKEMLRLDTYYSVKEAAPHSHQDYPPAIQLVEFIWCRLSGTGYDERTLYRALQTFLLSLYLPVFENLKIVKERRGRNIVLSFFAAVLILVCPLVMDTHLGFYNRICVDYSLAVITAYIITDIVITKEYTVLFFCRTALSMSFLILTKQMGLPLYLLSAGILLMLVFTKEHVHKSLGRSMKKNVFSIAAVCAFPVMTGQIWSYYVRDTAQQFRASDIDIFSLLSIVKGTGKEAYQHTSFLNFMDKFLTFDMTGRPFSMTYWQTACLLGGLTLLLCMFQMYQKNEILILDSLLAMGSAAYAFTMLLLYIYCFGAVEGPLTASYKRYMASYLAGWAAVLIMLFIHGLIKAERYGIRNIIFSVMLCLAFMVSGTTLKEIGRGLTGSDALKDCRAAEKIIQQHTLEDAKILYVCQGDNGWNLVRLRYLGMPRTSEFVSLGDPSCYTTNQIYVSDLSAEEAQNIFSQFDYVYLYMIDEQFVQRYAELFEDRQLSEGQLYKVVNEDSVLEFVSDGN